MADQCQHCGSLEFIVNDDEDDVLCCAKCQENHDMTPLEVSNYITNVYKKRNESITDGASAVKLSKLVDWLKNSENLKEVTFSTLTPTIADHTTDTFDGYLIVTNQDDVEVPFLSTDDFTSVDLFATAEGDDTTDPTGNVTINGEACDHDTAVTVEFEEVTDTDGVPKIRAIIEVACDSDDDFDIVIDSVTGDLSSSVTNADVCDVTITA